MYQPGQQSTIVIDRRHATSRIVVDAAFRSKSGDLESPTQWCDEEGRVLGRFLPEGNRPMRAGVALPNRHAQFERRPRDEPGRSWEDHLHDLEAQ